MTFRHNKKKVLYANGNAARLFEHERLHRMVQARTVKMRMTIFHWMETSSSCLSCVKWWHCLLATKREIMSGRKGCSIYGHIFFSQWFCGHHTKLSVAMPATKVTADQGDIPSWLRNYLGWKSSVKPGLASLWWDLSKKKARHSGTEPTHFSHENDRKKEIWKTKCSVTPCQNTEEG